MTAGELCSRIVVFAERNMGLHEAARLMREHHAGSLVVPQETAKGRVPVGILTGRDVTGGVIAKDIDPRTLRVDDVLSADLNTVREHDGVLGVVSEQIADLAHAIAGERTHEARTRP
jgi:CBS domain-containing protein